MEKPFRVALLVESSRTYGRELLRGIAAFGREHANWTFFHEERSLGDQAPSQLRHWRPDGVIARLSGLKLIRQIRGLRVPIVDLFNEDAIAGIPGVAVDQNALIEMAITHFRERGFRSFAYCGFSEVRFSELREECFVQRAARLDCPVSVFRYPPLANPAGLVAVETHAMRYAKSLQRWLKELPKPAGLLACNDVRGRQVLAACAEAGIAVPADVAVLGVDNDDVYCELSRPPMSSIDPNVHAIGYEAAALLQKLFDGQRVSSQRVLVQPTRVVSRRSTDVLAIADRHVADAVRFVHDHACDGMRLETILAQLRLSRSTLERWFQRVFNHSLTDEIVRVRINRAADLLLTTSLKIETIAHRSGFAHVESMSRIFKRMQGVSPGQYRTKFSEKGASDTKE